MRPPRRGRRCRSEFDARDDDPVAPQRLGPAKRPISLADEAAGGHTRRVDGCADADGKPDRLAVDDQLRGRDAPPQALRQPWQGRAPAARQNDRELFAAIAKSQIDLTQLLAQQPSQPSQRLVASAAAEPLVAEAEMVDVDQQQTQLVAVASGPLHLELPLGVEVPAADQASQAVSSSTPRQLLLQGAGPGLGRRQRRPQLAQLLARCRYVVAGT